MDRVLLLDVQDPHDGFARTVVGVVTMTPQLTGHIFICAKLARELREKNPDFQWISFNSSAVDYYEYDDELDPEQSEHLVEQIPVFVKENPFPKSSIERTESDQMRIDEEGVWWCTSSKHSGEMSHTMFVHFNAIEKFLAEDQVVKIHLYCPPESTCKKLEADINLPEVPAVGDTIYCAELAPETGPGASAYLFKVVSRSWGPKHVMLTLTHVWELRTGED